VLAALTICAAACERRRDADVSLPEASRNASEGSVSLTVTARPAETDLATQSEVIVEAIAGKGTTVQLEDYGGALREGDLAFQIVAKQLESETARPAPDGNLRWRQVYRLSFFLPGSFELPPAKLSYFDDQTPADSLGTASDTTAPAMVRTLQTEPVSVRVIARPGDEIPAEELTRITVLKPYDPQATWRRWWWPIAAVVAVALAMIVIRRRRSAAASAPPPIPAHEWANARIAELLAEDMIRQGRVQEFFYRICDIFRGYVERRFGVSAPEMTTEEFLEVAARDGRFGMSNDSTHDRPRAEKLEFEESSLFTAHDSALPGALREFLSACDMVKYARHEADERECDEVVRAAVRFIQATRQDVSLPVASTETGSAGEASGRIATTAATNERT